MTLARKIPTKPSEVTTSAEARRALQSNNENVRQKGIDFLLSDKGLASKSHAIRLDSLELYNNFRAQLCDCKLQKLAEKVSKELH